MKKIAITTTSFCAYDKYPLILLEEHGFAATLNPYGRKLKKHEILELCMGAEGVVAGTETLDAEVLKRLVQPGEGHQLRVISRCGTGMDSIDLEAAKRLGIKVVNTPEGPTIAVAELTIGLIINLLRKVSLMDRDLKNGVWKKHMGNLLGGKKVGIIGFGRIGRKVAELLMPFGVETAYCDICEQSCSPACSKKEMVDLLAWADIITLHCSAPERMPLMGKQELENMKQGSWIVNASRGGLIDEEALYSFLRQGHIAGAALDVFDKEPYSGPLTELDNVILTPHIGSYAKESRIEMEMQAVKNLLHELRT